MGPGDVLVDRYELGERLGRGGMGEVFRATDSRLGRTVAIKVLGAHMAGDEAAARRFAREARSAASLTHANIVAVHDASTDADRPFIVMELVDGPTLADVLGEGAIGIPRALAIGRDVADAISAAHERDLVHRDIKPSNVLIAPDGRVKVADFGIARAMSTSQTMTATIHGSPLYIAPEQASGDAPDPRSDVYSLGCVIYEMLAGQPPFAADSPVAIVWQHMNQEPKAPSTLRDGLPAGTDDVVFRALAKDPDQRYQSAAELRSDLERLAAGRPPLAAGAAGAAGAATVAMTGPADPADAAATVQMDDPADARTVAMGGAAAGAAGAAAGSGRTEVIDSGGGGREVTGAYAAGGGGGGRSRQIIVLAVLALVAVAAVILLSSQGGDGGAEIVASPEPTEAPTAAPPTTSAPVVETPTTPPPTSEPPPPPPPSPPPPPPPPATPEQAAADLGAILSEGVSAGQIDDKDAEDLDKKVEEVVKKYDDLQDADKDKDREKAAKEIDKKLEDLREERDELVEDDKIDPALAQRVNEGIAALEQTLA